MCSDCEAYGLKKHGLTRSHCIYVNASYNLLRDGKNAFRFVFPITVRVVDLAMQLFCPNNWVFFNVGFNCLFQLFCPNDNRVNLIHCMIQNLGTGYRVL